MSSSKDDLQVYSAKMFFLQLLKSLNKKKRDYSCSFKNFDESVVTITSNLGKQIIKKRNTIEEKTYYCEEWVREVSAVYGMETPGFKFIITEGEDNISHYKVKEHCIYLDKKLSLVTLLHEFRHAMQYKGFKMIDPDVEEDARAWSMSLFKIALPKLHSSAIQKGLVKYK